MSLPSDKEDFKEEEETFSDRDSSSDDSKNIEQDGKKNKRRSKKISKPAGVLGDVKISPGTSNSSKTGSEFKDAECSREDADSNSGDKNVGEVRDDIEHLKLNEEIAKGSEAKPLKPTGELQARPGASLQSQPDVLIPGTSTNKEKLRLTEEHVLEEKSDEQEVPFAEEDSASLPSSADLEFHGHAPPNTLNEPYDTDETSRDQKLSISYPTSKADLKRAAFAHSAENTLDDVSDITSDISDLQTDSNSIGQAAFHHAQLNTMPRDETDDSLVSDYKTVKSVMQDKGENSEDLPEDKNQTGMFQTPNKDASEYKTAKDDNSTSQSNPEDQSGSRSEDNVDETGSSNKSEGVEEDAKELGHQVGMEGQSGSDMEVGEESMNLVRDESERAKDLLPKEDVPFFPGSICNEDFNEPGVNPHSSDGKSNVDVVQPENEDGMDERVAREEMDGSINDQDSSVSQGGSGEQPSGIGQVSDQDGSGRQGTSNEQPSGIGQVSDQDGSGRQGTSDEQSNLVDEEVSLGQEDVRQQENADNFENFAAGRFARYQIDSTTSTSDSGFDNSDAVFLRNDRPNELAQFEVPAAFQDNSEDSSLAASGFAGLNDRQRWMLAGARNNLPLVDPNQPVLLNEGLDQNAPFDQSAPSTSSGNKSDYPGSGVVYLAKQHVINTPMESAEHFTSEQPVSDNVNSYPANLNLESRSTEEKGALGQRPNSPEVDHGKEIIPDEVETGNADPEPEDLPRKGKHSAAMDAKTCLRLPRDDLESSSSMDHSQDNSLADMDDAIESSEYSKSEGYLQLSGKLKPSLKSPRSDERPLLVVPKCIKGDAIESGEYSKSEGNLQLSGKLKPSSKSPRSDERPLLVEPKSTKPCSKQKLGKKPSQKRLAKRTPEEKLKKKRKGVNVSSRYQAQLNVDASEQSSSSGEESESK